MLCNYENTKKTEWMVHRLFQAGLQRPSFWIITNYPDTALFKQFLTSTICVRKTMIMRRNLFDYILKLNWGVLNFSTDYLILRLIYFSMMPSHYSSIYNFIQFHKFLLSTCRTKLNYTGYKYTHFHPISISNIDLSKSYRCFNLFTGIARVFNFRI